MTEVVQPSEQLSRLLGIVEPVTKSAEPDSIAGVILDLAAQRRQTEKEAKKATKRKADPMGSKNLKKLAQAVQPADGKTVAKVVAASGITAESVIRNLEKGAEQAERDGDIARAHGLRHTIAVYKLQLTLRKPENIQKRAMGAGIPLLAPTSPTLPDTSDLRYV